MVHFGLRAALSYFKWKRELLSPFYSVQDCICRELLLIFDALVRVATIKSYQLIADTQCKSQKTSDVLLSHGGQP